MKPNLHSIKEQASWCEDAGCSSEEQNPLDILHHCTEPPSLKSLPLLCLLVRNEAVRLRSLWGGKGWWWEPPRPATSGCFLVELAWADECEEPFGPSSPTNALHCYKKPASDGLLSPVLCWHAATKATELKWLFDAHYREVKWTITAYLACCCEVCLVRCA